MLCGDRNPKFCGCDEAQDKGRLSAPIIRGSPAKHGGLKPTKDTLLDVIEDVKAGMGRGDIVEI